MNRDDLNVPVPVTEEVARLHRAVDVMVRPLVQRHGERLRCRAGCTGCCCDGLTVFTVEAARIVREHAEWLRRATPHPPGGCAFLDEQGRCRIYAERPYVCRTQGLPLRWVEVEEASIEGSTASDAREDALRELRDICELNQDGEPLELLPAEACWTLGPVEGHLRRIQDEVAPGARVALRDLFQLDR